MVRATRNLINRLTLWRIVVTMLLLMVGALASVSGMLDWVRNRPPSLEEAFPAGEMRVAVDASFPPFAVDVGGQLDGLDIDLANALGDEMGIPVRFVNITFDGLYDSVTNANVDVVISALLINPAKTQDVRYTRPYYDNGLVLATTQGGNITTMRDLADGSLALEYGSFAHSIANDYLRRIDPFALRPYELPTYALDSTRLGDADAALVNTTSYRLYMRDHPEWASEAHRVTNAFYAIAVRKDREATGRWVDSALGDLINSGRMQAIIDEWL